MSNIRTYRKMLARNSFEAHLKYGIPGTSPVNDAIASGARGLAEPGRVRPGEARAEMVPEFLAGAGCPLLVESPCGAKPSLPL